MAYSFVAASSQYLSTASAPVTNVPCTLAGAFNTANTTTAQTTVGVQAVTDTSRAVIFENPGNITAIVGADLISSIPTDTVNPRTTATYSASTWVYNAGTFINGSSTTYLNGGNSVTATYVGTFPSITNFTQLSIGARHNGTSWGVYNDGLLAEIAVWSVTLTAAEIASLAKGFKPYRIRPQSLVFYAPLIRDLQDTKGALAITNNNTATVAVHPRVI